MHEELHIPCDICVPGVLNFEDGQAPSQTKLSVDSLTGKGIRDILRRVENGAKVKF